MKNIKRIFIVIILTYIVCMVTYKILKKGDVRYYNHSHERFTELFLRNTNYDILFIGSSRTHMSIYPKIMDTTLRINSYNAGIEGGNLLEFKMIVDAYLLIHPVPKYIVFTIDLGSFDLRNHFFNYSQYFDYTENRVIDSTIIINKNNTCINRFLPFFSMVYYNDYMKGNLIKGLFNNTEIPRGEFQYKGYLSNTFKVADTLGLTKLKISSYLISDTAKVYLNEIIATCKKQNIKLIFTYAPEYNFGLQKHIKNSQSIMDLIQKTAADNRILFFRDDKLELCKNPKYFANTGHLNTLGAYIYTKTLAIRMKKIIAR